jgi:hypothetical protein
MSSIDKECLTPRRNLTLTTGDSWVPRGSYAVADPGISERGVQLKAGGSEAALKPQAGPGQSLGGSPGPGGEAPRSRLFLTCSRRFFL